MRSKLFLLVLTAIVLTDCKRVPKFAPYIDVTREADFNLVEYKQKYGVNAFSLAFALGGTGGCKPMWGGQTPIDDPKIIDRIKEFIALGGDVIVSTGGAMGPYLESACSSVSALVNAYKEVLLVTGSTHLDIDIEASVPIDTMNKALATLQRENPSITVSFTLMIQGDDYGLTNVLGVDLLKSAVTNGVNVDIVNPMTMEFGSKFSSWGDAVITAAESTHKQMKGIWPQKSEQELYSMLGVTPMLGRNFNGRIFEPKHAKQLVQWALEKQIGQLAFWSINRDKGCPGGGISPSCSSIAQTDYEFTKIFIEFDGQIDTDPIVDKPQVWDPQPTEQSTTITTPSIIRTTKKIEIKMDCSVADRKYPHPTDCNKYFWCYNDRPNLHSCPPSTFWSHDKQYCDYPQNVNRPECQ